METKKQEERPWYLGVYETNDINSRKACEAILLFGMPNWRVNNPVPNINDFDSKHVSLPCPTCGFAHMFKRSEWYVALKLKTMGDYALKDPEDGQ